MKSILAGLMLLAASTATADPYYTSKDTYERTVTTNFKWHWPQQTVRTTTYSQTKPYYPTGRALFAGQEDVSRYRFYYRHRTSLNQWGYFFPEGTKLYSHVPMLSYGTPPAILRTLSVK